MTRPVFPFYANDISALARSLNSQMSELGHLPGHLEMLNILARAAGSRNFQHFRAQVIAERRLMSPLEETKPDYTQLQRLRRYFDINGRLLRWPTKFSDQEPCLWVLWSKLPSRKTLSEGEINTVLLENHRFEDPALLRRELKERKMVTRTLDGREYRRLERRPTAEALALIRLFGDSVS
jgi:hypothetical protein